MPKLPSLTPKRIIKLLKWLYPNRWNIIRIGNLNQRLSEAPRLVGGASLYFEGQSPSNSPKRFLFPVGVQRGKAPFRKLN